MRSYNITLELPYALSKKIQAIKLVRAAFNLGLSDAKQLVENPTRCYASTGVYRMVITEAQLGRLTYIVANAINLGYDFVNPELTRVDELESKGVYDVRKESI